jgi:hypothetical protein
LDFPFVMIGHMTKSTNDNDNLENDVYPFLHIAAATANALRFLFPEKPPGEEQQSDPCLNKRYEEKPDDEPTRGDVRMSWRGDAA